MTLMLPIFEVVPAVRLYDNPAVEFNFTAVNQTQQRLKNLHSSTNNDSTPHYNEEQEKIAWEKTIAFFNKHLS